MSLSVPSGVWKSSPSRFTSSCKINICMSTFGLSCSSASSASRDLVARSLVLRKSAVKCKDLGPVYMYPFYLKTETFFLCFPKYPRPHVAYLNRFLPSTWKAKTTENTNILGGSMPIYARDGLDPTP